MDFKSGRFGLTPRGNPRLRKAIVALNNDPSPENRQALYEAFVQGPILLGVHEIPPDMEEGLQVLKEDIQIEILTSDGPDGPPLILAFTDMEALNSRAPDVPFIAIDPVRLLQWVLEEGYGGIVINPSGPWAGIHRDEVEELLGVDERKGPAGGILSESLNPAIAIEQSLSKLVNRVNADAFAIFRESKADSKIIQFSGSTSGPLTLDFPTTGLDDRQVLKAQKIVSKLMRQGIDVSAFPLKSSDGHTYDPPRFQIVFGQNVARATQAALTLFKDVLGLPPKFHILIEEN